MPWVGVPWQDESEVSIQHSLQDYDENVCEVRTKITASESLSAADYCPFSQDNLAVPETAEHKLTLSLPQILDDE